ncbi:MAG TPA: hypothetical protein VKJ01_06360 [Candidatus Solibacter sp.]|nr:hypothetical protein [Candidatus Solibacter sp.]
MDSKTGGERIDRLEQVVQIIAEDQVSLQKLIAELATETRRGFDRVAEQFAETERRMRETDVMVRENMRQTDALMRESGRQTDERISRLVLAIGDLIRSQNPQQN